VLLLFIAHADYSPYSIGACSTEADGTQRGLRLTTSDTTRLDRAKAQSSSPASAQDLDHVNSDFCGTSQCRVACRICG
jgi:hypothetical protein